MLQSPYLPKEENDGNHLRNYLIQLLQQPYTKYVEHWYA